MKILKWLAIIVGGIATALIIAILWLLFGLDPNSFKPDIERLAAAEDIQLDIRGELSWTLWPDIALEIGETQLAAPDQGITTLSWQQAQLSVNKRALLKRQVLFNAIDIHQAHIAATTLIDAGAVALAPAATNGVVQHPAAPRAFSVAINRFSLNDSKATITNPESPGPLTINIRQLTTRQLNVNGQPFPASLDISIQRPEQPTIAFAGDVALTADASQQVFTWTGENMALRYDRIPAFQLNLSGRFDGKQEQLTLDKLSVTGQGLSAQASATLTNIPSAPELQGALSLSGNNVANLAKALQLTESVLPFKKFQVQSNIAASSQKIALSSFSLALDEYSFNGSGHLELLPDRNLELQLTSSPLNLDKLSSSGNNKSDTDTLLAPLLAPLALLEGGKGHIEFSAPVITSGDLKVEQAHLNLFANDNVVRITDLSGSVFNGQFQVTSRIDFRKTIPELTFTHQLRNIDLAQAAASLAKSSDFQGTADIDFNGASRGSNLTSIKDHLRGKGTFSITEPVMKNLNIEQTFCDLAARINPKYGVEKSWPQQTDFNTIDGTFQLNGDNLQLQSVTTGVGNIAVNAKGNIELQDRQLNLLITNRLAKTSTSPEGCTVSSKLVNQNIPMQCSGSFAEGGKLGCRPDNQWVNRFIQTILLQELQQQLFKKEKEQPKQSIDQSEEQTTKVNAEETKPATEKKPTKEEMLDNLLRGILK